jgi:hypothetical protein
MLTLLYNSQVSGSCYKARLLPAHLGVGSGPPSAVSAQPGDLAAAVSWTAPAGSGGSQITGYVVTPYVDQIAQPPATLHSTATTQTIGGLTNGASLRSLLAQTVTGLVNGGTYTFDVAGFDFGNGEGPYRKSNHIIVGTSVRRPRRRRRQTTNT